MMYYGIDVRGLLLLETDNKTLIYRIKYKKYGKYENRFFKVGSGNAHRAV